MKFKGSEMEAIAREVAKAKKLGYFPIKFLSSDAYRDLPRAKDNKYCVGECDSNCQHAGSCQLLKKRTLDGSH